MERRLAAILAADVVGYSAMMGENETRALDSIRRLREELFEPEVHRRRGVVVKRMGDGWLVEFASVVDAVECAVAVQEALEAEAFSLRIGVHIGDIVHADGDIYGDGVNVAARLEALGQPGFITISNDVRRLVAGSIETTFHDNGKVKLKNIGEPVQIWSWPEVIVNTGVMPVVSSAKPAIYVARFDARGGDAEEMAEALQDELRTAFARQTGVALISDAARAEYVLGGSVRGKGVRWRISADLTDATSDEGVWSERYDEKDDDVFGIQDRCVTRITGAVRIRLPSLLVAKLSARPLETLNVEELLNLAMNNHFTPTAESWERSVPALQMVLEQDPENWMAMTMLCFNRIATGRIFGWQGVSGSDDALARLMIERAKEIKPYNEVVRTVHGGFFLYLGGDHRAARIEAEEALKLNPNFYHSINLMSQVELFDGHVERAREWASEAIECDPAYPYLHLYQRDAGQVELAAGDYDTALDLYERADHAAPNLPPNLIGICAGRQLSGDGDGARDAMEALLGTVPGFNLADLRSWPFRDPSRWEPIKEALMAAGAPLLRPLKLVEGGAA